MLSSKSSISTPSASNKSNVINVFVADAQAAESLKSPLPGSIGDVTVES